VPREVRSALLQCYPPPIALTMATAFTFTTGSTLWQLPHLASQYEHIAGHTLLSSPDLPEPLQHFCRFFSSSLATSLGLVTRMRESLLGYLDDLVQLDGSQNLEDRLANGIISSVSKYYTQLWQQLEFQKGLLERLSRDLSSIQDAEELQERVKLLIKLDIWFFSIETDILQFLNQLIDDLSAGRIKVAAFKRRLIEFFESINRASEGDLAELDRAIEHLNRPISTNNPLADILPWLQRIISILESTETRLRSSYDQLPVASAASE